MIDPNPRLASAFLTLAAFALVLPLRAADPAVRVLKDVPFLAATRAEKLDVYLPKVRAPGIRSPAVVWIHGGGWRGGTKNEARARNICTTLAEAGYAAVSIDYRLGPGAWPQNLHDCKNAIRYLRVHAGEYGVDPDRIAVAGGSAGGHLALMVGLTAGLENLEPAEPYPGVSSAVRGIVNFYGITNLMTRQQTDAQGRPTATRRLMGKSLELFGATSEDADVLRVASPVTHLKHSSPPILTLHGRADATVDYGQAGELARVARSRNARHQLILLEGVGHSFDLQTWAKKPLPRDLRPVMLDFLEKELAAAKR